MPKPSVICLSILVLILSACVRPFTPASKETVTPDKSQIHPELENIPIYPGSTAWREGIAGIEELPDYLNTYSYVANVFRYQSLVKFYEENMADAGWDLLQKSEDRKARSAELMFSKGETVAHLQMTPWTANSYLVGVVFYDEPAIE
jgi:hypothetical protein